MSRLSRASPYREADVREGVALPRRHPDVAWAVAVGVAVLAGVILVGWFGARASTTAPGRSVWVAAFPMLLGAVLAARVASGRATRPITALHAVVIALGLATTIGAFASYDAADAESLAALLRDGLVEPALAGCAAAIASALVVAFASLVSILGVDVSRMRRPRPRRRAIRLLHELAPALVVLVAFVALGAVASARSPLALALAPAFAGALFAPAIAQRLEVLSTWHDPEERAHVGWTTVTFFGALACLAPLVEIVRGVAPASDVLGALAQPLHVFERVALASRLAACGAPSIARALGGSVAVLVLGVLALRRASLRSRAQVGAAATLALAFAIPCLLGATAARRAATALESLAIASGPLRASAPLPRVKWLRGTSAPSLELAPDMHASALRAWPAGIWLAAEGASQGEVRAAGPLGALVGPRRGVIRLEHDAALAESSDRRTLLVDVAGGAEADVARVGVVGTDRGARWIDAPMLVSLADEPDARAARRRAAQRDVDRVTFTVDPETSLQRVAEIVTRFEESLDTPLPAALASDALRPEIDALFAAATCEGPLAPLEYPVSGDPYADAEETSRRPIEGTDRVRVEARLGRFLVSYTFRSAEPRAHEIRDGVIRDLGCSGEGLRLPPFTGGAPLALRFDGVRRYTLTYTEGGPQTLLSFERGPR